MIQNKMPPIYGFTLLRNGVKYDYSFKESLRSLGAVTRCVYLALGQSEDETEKAVKDLDFLVNIPTVWDDSLKDGAIILSQQTNIALNEARLRHRKEVGAWGIYLQCDEVFHHEDYALIIEDIKEAERLGHDVIKFRYLHFWQDHHHIAINKKWYPHEIRAVKLDSDTQSWGDAQSFRHYKNPYESEARIFHYGHVREPNSYKNKKSDILKLYHSDEKMAKYKRKEKRHDAQTECLLFLGNHPKEMQKRITALGDIWEWERAETLYIVGDKTDYSPHLISKINAKNIYWVKKISEVPKKERSKAVITRPTLFQTFFFKSRVPKAMRSKLARPWSDGLRLTLLLSEKGVGLKASSEIYLPNIF